MKRAQRHQKGYVFRKGGGWYLRYYDTEIQADGTPDRIMKCKKLVDFGGDYRSKSAARVLADEVLAPLNNGTMSPASTMTLNRWIEKRYLPFIKAHREPSTYAGYNNAFELHIRKHGHIALRDVRTFYVEKMLQDIAHEFDTAKTTIQHDKFFLSGAFKYAKRQGVLNNENPVRDAALPNCKETEDTHAYSLVNELKMIEIPPEPASTVVALFAFAGLRKGEVRGGRWEAYTGDEFRVMTSVWRKHAKGPKTKASKAPVPVIAMLAEKPNAYRKQCGSPESGWMFPNSVGNPLCLDRLANDVIHPALKAAGIDWHGWHAFRRGLATNLHRLKVSDKIIQRILRHANVRTTQDSYIKTADDDAVGAMKQFEAETVKTHTEIAVVGEGHVNERPECTCKPLWGKGFQAPRA